MNLKNIVIILDHPDESRNIGAVCRAMANNDIKELRIVGNRDDYDIEHIHVLAIHAGYIFDNAHFYNSIIEATKDCSISAGTTRRRGKKRGKLYLPEEFAQKASEITSNETINTDSKVAVIFGNERTGLTDDQLSQCTVGVTIPSSDDFGSLNLSHAVQIICYHLFRENLAAHNKAVKSYQSLSLERIDSTVKTITDNLKEIGFFKMPGREEMENFWRSILSRASMSESEVQYLEKIFTKISGLNKKNHEKNHKKNPEKI